MLVGWGYGGRKQEKAERQGVVGEEGPLCVPHCRIINKSLVWPSRRGPLLILTKTKKKGKEKEKKRYKLLPENIHRALRGQQSYREVVGVMGWRGCVGVWGVRWGVGVRCRLHGVEY